MVNDVDVSKKQSLWRLFRSFLQIGCFTFGGGLNIVAQIQHRYVDQEKLLTEEDILDCYCLGKSVPGTMVTNVAYLVGYQLAGISGGIVCVLGLIAAPTGILLLIALFYDAVKENPYVGKAMIGVRAAVVPIIVVAVLRMLKSSFPDWLCIPVAAAAFILFYFLNGNSLLIILFCGLFGVLIGTHRRRKDDAV